MRIDDSGQCRAPNARRQREGNTRSQPPAHPFLLVAALILAKAISEDVSPAGFARPLLAGLLAVGTITAIGAIATRSWRSGGLLATAVFLLLISRAPVVALLRVILDLFGIPGGTTALTTLVVIILLGLGFAVIRLRYRLVPSAARANQVTSGLNVFAGVLLALALLPSLPHIPRWLPATTAVDHTATANRPLPDMYLIILDGYPRADELAAQFAFDNSGFVSDLEDRDFIVQTHSRSNYTNTALTLPSLLGMDYLTTDTSATFTDAGLRRELGEALRNGPGFRGLHQAGYEVIGTSPGWEQVSLRAGVDLMIERPELTDLERFLLWNTWVLDLPGFPPDLYFAQLHSRVQGVLSDALHIATSGHGSPVFAFIHVPAPHLPFAFGSDGGSARIPSRMYGAQSAADYGLSDQEYAAAYSATIRALNAQVVFTLDGILAESATPPVIVVMSDHGYDGPSSNGGDSKLHNFFAAYTPDHAGLLNSATPVNVLRILLRAYAEIDLGEPLPDRYFTTRTQDDLTTVTETTTPG